MVAMRRVFALLTLLLVAGCGAEVAGTAAVGARGQAEQARQAQELKDQIQTRLDAAAQIQAQKLRQTEAASRP